MTYFFKKTCYGFTRCATFFAIIFSGHVFCQHINPGVQLSQYVFKEFGKGTVKMKSGETSEQLLNYNILTGEMIFVNSGRYLAIAEPANVDTIFIQARKFIPVNNKFFEVLVDGDAPLLLEFTYSIIEPGKPIGYGNSSSTSAATTYKSILSSGGAYDLKLPDGFTVVPHYAYWIRKDNKLEKAGTVKQLSRIFPDKKEVISEYIKKNNTDYSKREDIISLVQQIE